ncbi:peptidase S8/S53 domain-containing protein [Tribonema minus]|uniref:subtilisin n=1 Tax=Tribonema minus TaxID=303371 RepID=A0A836C9E9_9STRA|nr:peptidase S8/S53 domain-containing protein [Tribonema minus]
MRKRVAAAALALVVVALFSAPGAAALDSSTEQEWIAVLEMDTHDRHLSAAALNTHTALMTANIATGAAVIRSVPEIGMVVLVGSPESASSVQQMQGVESVIPSLTRRFLPEDPAGIRASRELHGMPVYDDAQTDEPDTQEHEQSAGDDANRELAAKKKLKEPNYRPLQWSRTAIKATRAAKAGIKGKGARVAVLDTGFYLDHPALKHYNKKLSKSMVKGEKLQFSAKAANDRFFLDASHGTHTASILGGADLKGVGTVGVAPEADLVLIKVLYDSGRGSDRELIEVRHQLVATVVDYAQVTSDVEATARRSADSSCAFAAQTYEIEAAMLGILYAIDVGVDVMSMSLSFVADRRGAKDDPNTPQDDSYSASYIKQLIKLYTRVFKIAYNNDVTVVVSIDNDGHNYTKQTKLYSFHAALPHTIGVTATGPVYFAKNQKTSLDKPSGYSSFGGRDVIDFAAPGGTETALHKKPKERCKYKLGKRTLEMPCAYYDWVIGAIGSADATFAKREYGFATRYGWFPGNSMATPHVAGVAALITGKKGKRVPPDQMFKYLKQCSDDIGAKGKDQRFGYGRINAGKVVDLKV